MHYFVKDPMSISGVDVNSVAAPESNKRMLPLRFSWLSRSPFSGCWVFPLEQPLSLAMSSGPVWSRLSRVEPTEPRHVDDSGDLHCLAFQEPNLRRHPLHGAAQFQTQGRDVTPDPPVWDIRGGAFQGRSSHFQKLSRDRSCAYEMR